MRVDPFYIVNLSAPLNQTQVMQQQLTDEISSGVRVTSLGDDPVTAAQNVQLLNQIQRDDSFTQTANFTHGALQVTDSALGSVTSQLNQAIALATEGNNGSLNAGDLKAISNQLVGIRDEVLSLANTSYQGQYVFAGSKGSSAPFSLSNSTIPATVTYGGDSNVNLLQSPNGQTIQLNIPGNEIFMSGTADVLGSLNNLIADFATGSSNGGVPDTEALSGALNFVSQQRVTLDNSISRLTVASESATSESTQLTAVQTNLMQADIAGISTQFSLTKTQQTALINVISALGSGSLFDKL